jgi:competence protein ComEA
MAGRTVKAGYYPEVLRQAFRTGGHSIKAGRFVNGWTLAAAVLAVIIIAGGVYIGVKYHRDTAVEITIPAGRTVQGTVYIGGEVNNPGSYPLYPGDSFDDLVRAAGGVTDNADLSHIELDIAGKGEAAAPQKVDINTADVWLLAALPGIGEVRAQAIVDYRGRNGPFRDIREILKVEGLGDITFERIKDLITVGDGI